MATPNRQAGAGGRIPGQGHYADPSSPIASTPSRPRVTPAKALPATPSLAALSPMKQPKERPLQRAESGGGGGSGAGAGAGGAVGGDDGKSWTSAIFSPVLRFLGGDEEKAAAEAAAATASAGGSLTRLAQPSVGTATLAGSPAAGGANLSSLQQRVASVSVGAGSAGGGGSKGGASEMPEATSMAAVAAAGAEAAAKAAIAAGATTTVMVAPPPPQEYEEFNPYLFIKMLPPYHTVAPAVPRIALVKKNKRMPDINLILDLDETLVHCSVDPIPDADVTFPVNFNGANYQVYVRKRPHLDKFFALIAGKFEVTVFTASQQVYAERLLNLLDPEGRHIHHRLYRDSCLNVDGNFLKDLNVLGRDLSKTVLVDNSPHAFGFQLDNGIPIESWFDDKKDTELLKLAAFVHTLLGQDDVRPLVRERFRLWHLVESSQTQASW